MKNYIKILALLPLFSACDDLFDPALENNRDIDAMYDEPSFAQGILANAYILKPYSSSPTSDLATDDAVTNDNSSNWIRMATGSWTASNDEASQWKNRYNAIQYINLFLERVDDVEWARDEDIKMMFRDRLKGEAYGLRALNMYYLLRSHAGWTEDGELLGVMIKTDSENIDSDFNQPRKPFYECIDSIYKDCERALELLPLDYGVKTDADVPEKYKEYGVNGDEYERVTGENMRGRISGRIVEAIRAQVALLAASPAYNTEENKDRWAQAADYAAIVIDRLDAGNIKLDADGYTWYCNKTEIDNNISGGKVPEEILWRSDNSSSNSLEASNFPPSLFGTGLVNPTQNLVDAFPMANGYPINHISANYHETNPYADRDPRLTAYVLYNGGTQGPSNSTIITADYGENEDAINRESGYSTRTGYYLKKLLRPDCNLDPTKNTTQKHYTAYIRYTEIYLAYAEAAFEAWGAEGTGTHSYSAVDVIKAIRSRAGVGNDYVDEVKDDEILMRELIHNERRLELCFENHRFYDLRRWKVSLDKLNETARGMRITGSEGNATYSPIDVEKRAYEDYQYYGPIPYSEVVKYSELEQNKGW